MGEFLINAERDFDSEGSGLAKARDLRKICELNKAACFLKMGAPADALLSCKEVLTVDDFNVKALYRRAQAEFQLGFFDDCIASCRQVVEHDPENKEARGLLKRLMDDRKKEDAEDTGLFSKMCKGIGSGPIREPGKAARPRPGAKPAGW